MTVIKFKYDSVMKPDIISYMGSQENIPQPHKNGFVLQGHILAISGSKHITKITLGTKHFYKLIPVRKN